ncbi:MAG: Uma2 family endonuclease [Aphanocapsa sp. GSE-SYN-MK-11-07L]|jgi:Uma2 family endonuclease|nr:Uma2 family endonuclease [Aphanocapsa sp. GSE-SYN-MK-11-07L]
MKFFQNRKPAPNEQRIVLSKVNWAKFEALLLEMGEGRSAHLTYDRGALELMTPLAEHERSSKLVESLLLLLSDELKQPVLVQRSRLLKRFDLQQAVEPDICCFFDPKTSPLSPSAEPTETLPDLIMEVALTHSSLDKLPIYANFAIPEVWRYLSAGERQPTTRYLRIYHLKNQSYTESDRSLHFPFLTAATVLQFLDQSDTFGLMPSLRLLREWLQQQGGG